MGAILATVGFLGFVVCLIVLVIKAIKKSPKKNVLGVLFLCFFCFAIGVVIIPVDDTVGSANPTGVDEKAPTKEEIKETYVDATYKDLMRNPDNYEDMYVIVTVKISQILKDGKVYYFGYTDNDGYGLYFDDEFCFLDERVDDDTKLLEDDVLKIYGRFSGLRGFKRALTKVESEIPCVEMLYAEIIDE